MENNSRFESIGVYLPTTMTTTRELIAQMEVKPCFDLEAITGIKTRRVHDKRPGFFEDSFTLAALAAKDCLQRSRYRADQLDAIISVSITRFKDGYHYYFEPSFALLLKRALGATTALHFDASNACAGMMTGVYMLDRMIKAGIVRNGMVVSGECITPISDTAVREIRDRFDDQFGSLTVGDSGAAVILDQAVNDDDKIHYVDLMTCAEYSKLCIGMASDKAGSVALYTNNREMHKEDCLYQWPHFVKNVLAKRGTSFEQERFDYVVHHQVGKGTTRKLSEAGSAIFGAAMPESLTVLEELGNTASTSHFVVLHKHLKENKLKKGAKLLLVPAASGIVTGCVASTITSLAA